MVKYGMMGYYIVIKMFIKKFLITWGYTNVTLNRKRIKFYTQYDLIIVKRYMHSLYVLLVFWKCHQYINSVSLLVVGFGGYFTFFFVLFASFVLELLIASMHSIIFINTIRLKYSMFIWTYIYGFNLDIHKTTIHTDRHTYT